MELGKLNLIQNFKYVNFSYSVFFMFILLTHISGCESTSEAPIEENIIGLDEASDFQQDEQEAVVIDPEKQFEDIQDNECREMPQLSDLPVWNSETKTFLSKVLKECQTPNGVVGLTNKSSLIVVGIPCSGGESKLEIGGTRWKPKFLKFSLAPNCKMFAKKQFVEESLKIYLQVNKPKIISYTSFNVIFWELPEFDLSLPGDSIVIASELDVEKVWEALKENKALQLTLLAKDVSWFGEPNYYKVKGKIVLGENDRYHLEVDEANVVTPEERKIFFDKCRARHARQYCTM